MAVSSAASRGQGRRGVRVGPEDLSNSLWEAQAWLDQAGTYGCPETHPLSSWPLPRALGHQAGHRFTGSKMDTNLPSISSAPRSALGRPTISDPVLLVWKSKLGVNPILAGVRGPIRTLGFLDAVISGWL